MKLLLIVLALTLLIAGCTNQNVTSGTQPPPANQAQNQIPAITPPANISQAANATVQNQTQNTNTSQTTNTTHDTNATQNASLPLTNKTPSELLDAALSKATSDFYRQNSGSFQEKTYRWVRFAAGTSPDEISFSQPASDVRFDGSAIDSIQASGFVMFTNTANNISRAYGISVFQANNTPLDAYTSSDVFSVDYAPPIFDKKLRDCSVYGRDYNLDAHGKMLITYMSECGVILDK